jgi:formate hydrogenlyase subunit 6/NADH:ubiquinone oxidoreductase subunit I
MKLTLQHLKASLESRMNNDIGNPAYFEGNKGIQTLQYPYSSMPVPDNGRYRLHNEMDDCIVCDKCAKVCPVNCIDIEPIKATEVFGKTSDGTPKRLYAAVFDIDMAKCCFCGLCTTVCPTECLTMTKVYDFPEFDIRNMNYHFGNLTPELAQEKRLELEISKELATAKLKPATDGGGLNIEESKSVFKPKIVAKPTVPAVEPLENEKPAAKPVFKPRMPVKPKLGETPQGDDLTNTEVASIFKNEPETESEMEKEAAKNLKPVFKPKMKPIVKPPDTSGSEEPLNL